jgi:hypothetical protein
VPEKGIGKIYHFPLSCNNANTTQTNTPDIGTKKKALESEGVPSSPQRVIDRSNPDEKILEKIGQQFKDASQFLKDDVETIKTNPEGRAGVTSKE